jgi:hypothetical protein
MPNPKIAIVVLTYNRPISLGRLLYSLLVANYQNLRPDLIISIDHSGRSDCACLATDFDWQYGEKIVVQHSARLGLRDHVLSIGNYFENYDALIVLEDDLYVSPSFYLFAARSVSQFREESKIAGISLYSPAWSEFSSRPFSPMVGNFSVYLMQYAQSWGQIWLKKQWLDFMEWYSANSQLDLASDDFPSNVSSWPESSWLKYHIKYCVERNKYFVYPYHSLTTNFSEVGTHNSSTNTIYQVSIVYSGNYTYIFPDGTLTESLARYDVFYERQGLGSYLLIPEDELIVDLYGKKLIASEVRYVLTMKRLPYGVVKKFGLIMRPHEANVVFDIPGDSIILYDTSVRTSEPISNEDDVSKWIYDVKGIPYLTISSVLLRKILTKLKPYELLASIAFHSRRLLSKIRKPSF